MCLQCAVKTDSKDTAIGRLTDSTHSYAHSYAPCKLPEASENYFLQDSFRVDG
jgi:hypothetical protein